MWPTLSQVISIFLSCFTFIGVKSPSKEYGITLVIPSKDTIICSVGVIVANVDRSTFRVATYQKLDNFDEYTWFCNIITDFLLLCFLNHGQFEEGHKKRLFFKFRDTQLIMSLFPFFNEIQNIYLFLCWMILYRSVSFAVGVPKKNCDKYLGV